MVGEMYGEAPQLGLDGLGWLHHAFRTMYRSLALAHEALVDLSESVSRSQDTLIQLLLPLHSPHPHWLSFKCSNILRFLLTWAFAHSSPFPWDSVSCFRPPTQPSGPVLKATATRKASHRIPAW